MASQFPNGSAFAISVTYGSPVTISAISNAATGVATAAAHGLSDGDILIVSSGWTALDQRVVRVDNSTTGTFELEGVNTADTKMYPAGGGVGAAKEVLTWTSLSQVTNSASSGGEAQFYQWKYIDDASGRQRQRRTGTSPKSLQLTMDDDATLAWHDALLAASRSRETTVLRVILPSGAVLYYSMEVTYDGEPTMTADQNMQVVATFSHIGDFNRYAS